VLTSSANKWEQNYFQLCVSSDTWKYWYRIINKISYVHG